MAPRLVTLFTGSGNVTNPLDTTTYYAGSMVNSAMSTTQGARRVYVPVAGTIRAVNLDIWSSTGVVGTNEAIEFYIRKNATTDYLIESEASTDLFRLVKNDAMNVPVAMGDWFEIKVICPTWVTNPTNWIMNGFIIIESE
jgi:hypothetical protein